MNKHPLILVRYYANLRDVTGKKEEYISADSIYSVLEILKSEYGDKFTKMLYRDGNLIGNVIIMVNGKNIRFINGLNSKITSGDEVDIFPPVAGG